jgi:hypothetical protein
MTMKKFPKLIYVNHENENTADEYFDVIDNIQFLPDETCKIAIYELKEIKNLTIKKELK